MASLGPASKLLINQATIEKLLKVASTKIQQKKDLFVKVKLDELNAENERLKTQMRQLLTRLTDLETAAGVKQIATPTSSTTSQAENQKQKQSPKPAKPTVEGEPKGQDKGKQKKTQEPKKNAGGKAAPAAVDTEVDVGRLDLRVGRILEAAKHPDADSLYVEKVDLGEAEPRTVVSGLVRHVPVEQMQNRLVVCLCNLKPMKMRGVESKAMVMCASTPEKVEILEVDPGSKPGQPVTCEPFKHRPDTVLNPKKKVWETVAVDLAVAQDGRAAYKGHPLFVDGQTPITAPTLREVPVK